MKYYVNNIFSVIGLATITLFIWIALTFLLPFSASFTVLILGLLLCWIPGLLFLALIKKSFRVAIIASLCLLLLLFFGANAYYRSAINKQLSMVIFFIDKNIINDPGWKVDAIDYPSGLHMNKGLERPGLGYIKVILLAQGSKARLMLVENVFRNPSQHLSSAFKGQIVFYPNTTERQVYLKDLRKYLGTIGVKNSIIERFPKSADDQWPVGIYLGEILPIKGSMMIAENGTLTIHLMGDD